MGISNEELLKNIRYYQESLDKYTLNKNNTKLLSCIEKLKKLPISTAHLEDTGIGRTVNALRKLGGEVGDAAKGLVARWKEMVMEEEEKAKKEVHEESVSTTYSTEDDTENNEEICEDIKENDSSSSHISSDTEKRSSEKHRKESDKYSSSSRKSKEKKDTYRDSDNSSKKRKQDYHSDSDGHNAKKKHVSTSSESEDEERTKSKSHRRHRSESSEGEKKYKQKKSKYSNQDSDSEDSEHKSRSSSKKPKSSEKTDEKPKSKHKSKRETDCEDNKSSSKNKSKKSDPEETKIKKHDSRSRHEKESKPKDSKSHSSRSETRDKKESKSESKDKHSHRKDDNRRQEKKPKEEKENGRKEKSSHSSASKSEENAGSSKRKSSSDRKKDKTKVVDKEKIVNGIDSGSGASFADALGMCGPMISGKSPSSKRKKPPSAVSPEKPRPSSSYAKPERYEEEDEDVPNLLKQEPPEPLNLNISTLLPEITPHYKPLGIPLDLQPRRVLTPDEALSQAISNKNMRTKVYSGNKSFGKVETLFDLCVRILQDNIDALEYTGGVPYLILKPVLERATPDQLFNMEHHNPYLIEDTDELWHLHCQKEFRTKKREELESWREMYMRCLDEREARLNAITANIKQSQDKSTPVRTTKLAYIDSVVKPPRNVARKQAKNGLVMDKRPSQTPSSRLAALATSGDAGKVAVPNPGRGAVDRSSSSSSNSAAFKPKKAPLMAKTLSLFKNRFRR